MDADAALRDVRGLAGDIGPERQRRTTSPKPRIWCTPGSTDWATRYGARRFWFLPGTPGKHWSGVVSQRTSSRSRPASIPASLMSSWALTSTPCPRRRAQRTTRLALRSCCSWPGWRLRSQQDCRSNPFGAEEPRGSGDVLHHFRLPTAPGRHGPRRAPGRNADGLARPGRGHQYVPVCSANASGHQLRASVRAAARRPSSPLGHV